MLWFFLYLLAHLYASPLKALGPYGEELSPYLTHRLFIQWSSYMDRADFIEGKRKVRKLATGEREESLFLVDPKNYREIDHQGYTQEFREQLRDLFSQNREHEHLELYLYLSGHAANGIFEFENHPELFFKQIIFWALHEWKSSKQGDGKQSLDLILISDTCGSILESASSFFDLGLDFRLSALSASAGRTFSFGSAKFHLSEMYLSLWRLKRFFTLEGPDYRRQPTAGLHQFSDYLIALSGRNNPGFVSEKYELETLPIYSEYLDFYKRDTEAHDDNNISWIKYNRAREKEVIGPVPPPPSLIPQEDKPHPYHALLAH